MRGTDTTLGSIQTSLEAMEDPVMVTTSALDPPGPTIVFVNAAFCRVSGYAPDEILGKTPLRERNFSGDFAPQDRVQQSSVGLVFL